MKDYYRICAAKIIGTERVVLVKIQNGYVSPGNIVEFHIGVHRNLAEVLFDSLVRKGSDDEAVMMAVSPAYEIEKIYTKYWEKNEEEEKNGN